MIRSIRAGVPAVAASVWAARPHGVFIRSAPVLAGAGRIPFVTRLPWLAAAMGFVMLSLCAVPVSALDLETVLREVAEANPSLAARRSMVEASRRAVSPAGAWSSPMIELGVMSVPTSGRFNEEPMTMKTLGVSQSVPLFGSNGLRRRAASQAYQAEAASAEMAHYQFFAMAWGAFADAFYATELSRRAKQHIEVMDRLVLAARARYQAGNGRLDDVLRAEAERARVFADLASFEAEEIGARARLAALRGTVYGGEIESLEAPPAMESIANEATWQEAVNASHPQLREHDARVARSRFAARAMRRSLWPDLQLRASYGARETLLDGREQDNMFSAMVGFMVPIFASQSMLAEAGQMDAMAEAAASERRAEELGLREETSSMLASARAASRSVTLLADTVVVTQQRALDASWSGYSAGTTDLWRVLEAAHTLYLEEIALVRARTQFSQIQARLLAVTTRGDLLGVNLPEVERMKR